MLSNFDIEGNANYSQIPIVVFMKDELKNMKPINTNYIINLESSKDGNGTHWMGLIIQKNEDCAYFDSYGMLPPEEIISFCKTIPKSHLSYNTKEIQDFKAKTCGFFAIAFIIFLHINSSGNLYKKSSSFSDLFSLDTKLNKKKLQKFSRLLPKQSALPILKKLYSQKRFFNMLSYSICLKD